MPHDIFLYATGIYLVSIMWHALFRHLGDQGNKTENTPCSSKVKRYNRSFALQEFDTYMVHYIIEVMVRVSLLLALVLYT